MRRNRCLALAICSLLLGRQQAECLETEPSRPGYALNRADEEYRYLQDPASKGDFWDPVKYLPVNSEGNWYLSIGGEARERYEYFNNYNWGRQPGSNGYFLQRYFLHGDLHLGDHARLFAQFQSSLEHGRRGGPRPTDRDELDLHQAFLDLKATKGTDRNYIFRLGRQELAFGSQRLVSVREGPNVRRSFDGLRARYRTSEVQLDAFVTRPVETNRYLFDDGPDTGQALWGGYGVLPLPQLPEGHIDLYYLGLYRREASFDQGDARETRHSLGTRLWRTSAPLDYNFEAVYQWGSFGSGKIAAWTVASDTGYTMESLPLRPRVGLKADIASGDKNPENRDLQSFNPLFPKGAYFSEAGLIGPSNFIDLHPCLDLNLTEGATITFDWDFFWRQSTHDGLYNSAAVPVRSGQRSDASYIGSMPQVQLSWDIDRHLSLAAIYGHFFAGEFLKETEPGKDVDYVTTWVTYQF